MTTFLFKLFRLQNRSISILLPAQAVKRASKLFFSPRRHKPKAWELAAEQTGRRHTLSDTCSAISWGEGPKQILMVHGWEGRATQMSGFVPNLVAKGYKVIAIDAPGHGKSRGETSNPKRFVDAMFKAAERFGEFEAVIGHSMGGGTALYAAIEGLPTQKVISISGPSNFETVSRRFANFIGLTDSVTETFVNGVEKTVGIPFARINLALRGHELRIPLMIVHDKHDQEVPYWHADTLLSGIPNARLLKTESLGHRKIVRDAYVFESVSDFIAEPI